MSTTDTITLMAPDLAVIATSKPSLVPQEREIPGSLSKSRNMLPTINVTIANEFIKETLSALTTPAQMIHLSSPVIHDYYFPTASDYTLTPRQPARFFTPPSIPVLRASGSRPTSARRASKKSAAPRPGRRRVISLPGGIMGPPRPLGDGPMGYTYTPTASRLSGSLEVFLPPEHYVRHNTSNMYLVVSICGPAEKQVIVCTPGAAHAMSVEKKKGRIIRGARKMWRFFKKRVH